MPGPPISGLGEFPHDMSASVNGRDPIPLSVARWEIDVNNIRFQRGFIISIEILFKNRA
jgi:hypothetical protein